MNSYLKIYNKFISLTTNKSLYYGLKSEQDQFSDRLSIFLIHFAFFLKKFKHPLNKKKLQEIYDFNFRQLELSIREIGYGDQSINKKMKIYINIFHSMISEFHFWDNLTLIEKKNKLAIFLLNYNDIGYLIEYFDNFNNDLDKYDLNSYLKSVNK